MSRPPSSGCWGNGWPAARARTLRTTAARASAAAARGRGPGTALRGRGVPHPGGAGVGRLGGGCPLGCPRGPQHAGRGGDRRRAQPGPDPVTAGLRSAVRQARPRLIGRPPPRTAVEPPAGWERHCAAAAAGGRGLARTSGETVSRPVAVEPSSTPVLVDRGAAAGAAGPRGPPNGLVDAAVLQDAEHPLADTVGAQVLEVAAGDSNGVHGGDGERGPLAARGRVWVRAKLFMGSSFRGRRSDMRELCAGSSPWWRAQQRGGRRRAGRARGGPAGGPVSCCSSTAVDGDPAGRAAGPVPDGVGADAAQFPMRGVLGPGEPRAVPIRERRPVGR